MITYATPDDYEDVIQTTSVPDNIATLLRSASLLIARATRAAWYLVDDTGAPTDAKVIDAFKEATCIQASVWAGLGIDPNLGALDVVAPKRSKGIGSARVDYDTSATGSAAGFAARQALIDSVCPDSQEILREACLLPTGVWSY